MGKGVYTGCSCFHTFISLDKTYSITQVKGLNKIYKGKGLWMWKHLFFIQVLLVKKINCDFTLQNSHGELKKTKHYCTFRAFCVDKCFIIFPVSPNLPYCRLLSINATTCFPSLQLNVSVVHSPAVLYTQVRSNTEAFLNRTALWAVQGEEAVYPILSC